MNVNRIYAVIQKTLYNMKRDVFRIFDIFYWPAFELFMWGLFSIFIAKTSNSGVNIISILLGAIILWTFFDRSSRDLSIAMIDELWSRNFVNLFSTPLTIGEYLVGVAIVSILKLIISITFMFILAKLIYGFNISAFGLYLIPAAIGLTLFGWSLSIVVQAFIMRFGHTVEVFIWAVAILFQPLSCVFYPLSILPGWARTIAAFLPTTYLFENMRHNMMGQGTDWNQIAISFGLNFIYLIISFVFFKRSFAEAKRSGNLIKNY
jgi:ABC-2 type transport system permease protein